MSSLRFPGKMLARFACRARTFPGLEMREREWVFLVWDTLIHVASFRPEVTG
jgi:hypothetical protein